MGLFGKRGRGGDEELQQVATQLGLTYAEEGDAGVSPLDFFLLPSPSMSGATHILRGTHGGWPVRLFEWTAHGATDPLPALVDLYRPVSKVTRLTAVIVDLPRPVPTVVMLRGRNPFRKGMATAPTGHAGLDDAFTCTTRRPDAAAALASPPFAEVVLASPADFSFELTAGWVLVVCAPRPADQLSALAAYGTRVAAAVPDALYELHSAG